MEQLEDGEVVLWGVKGSLDSWLNALNEEGDE